MTSGDVLAIMQERGTEQNKKIYIKHGSGNKTLGVSFKDIKEIQKNIKKDHELSWELWKTEIPDAQILATMIADPKLMTEYQINKWIKDINYYVLADYFSSLISRTPFWMKKVKQWTNSEKEYIRRCGYGIISNYCKNSKEKDIDFLKAYLIKIEAEIHNSKNRAKEMMNNALISIGFFTPELKNMAIEAAKKIGNIEIDHGETKCKTYNAFEYLTKKEKFKKFKN
ncbi:3-methyladenine DNA glycosylase AlkD [Oceanotoga teriensis]|jgi:3-methyladenine DNA glycosylase AlkD|uniref:3-methyladenine DNA glycosylase AlkD n=1 Tax=Oceanotoga teriensis TaxID=515440 RepID=A0AA45C6N7_9BACT|nr:DNA alkylation repair protein [Oceanotoga teriensis]PWJ92189.1 3-methyladenine DNA glycosylase AlkD [Oceanotoga teriensis]